jgi:hypothetical protein
VKRLGINRNSIPAFAFICVCIYLTIGNEVTLEAQTNLFRPSILNTSVYTMEKLQRFRVAYPSNWNIIYDNDTTSIIKSPNHDAILTISVTNLSQKAEHTLIQYTEQEIKKITSTTTTAGDNRFHIVLLESMSYLLSGNIGHRIAYLNETQLSNNSVASISMPSELRQIVAWTLTGNRIYRVSCSTSESQYSSYSNIFNDILNSFELLQ